MTVFLYWLTFEHIDYIQGHQIVLHSINFAIVHVVYHNNRPSIVPAVWNV